MAAHQIRRAPAEGAFLTTEEVLTYLNVNVRTIYRLARTGAIPAVRIGRQWRFRRSDIDAWVDSRRTMPTMALASSEAWDPRMIG